MSLPFHVTRTPEDTLTPGHDGSIARHAELGSQPFGQGTLGQASRDPRALRILSKTIYRELRHSGLVEEDVMSVAGELLGLVAGDVKDRRRDAERKGAESADRSGSR